MGQGSSNPAGAGGLKRGGDARAAAEPGPDGSFGSYVRFYAPVCIYIILWWLVLWFHVVNVFRRFGFDLGSALIFFLTHTVPLVLFLRFGDLLYLLDLPVPLQPSHRPAAQEEAEYVVVHHHDAKCR